MTMPSGLKDLRLPLLAAASMHIGAAEEAFGEGAIRTCEHELDKAEQAMSELRQEYRELATSDKGLLGAMAAPLSRRIGELRVKMPAASSVSDAEAVADPEKHLNPEHRV